MYTWDVTGLKAQIVRPGMNLITYCNKYKPVACCNASLYSGVSTTVPPTIPCGTVIENGVIVHNDGNGYGVGTINEILQFGGPWEKTWKDYFTGYNSPVQNGQYVEPTFVDYYVFPNRLARLGIGRKQGRIYIVSDDNVTLKEFALNAINNGFDTLVNLDGGGSRHVYYNGKFVYSSYRIPYNALVFWNDTTVDYSTNVQTSAGTATGSTNAQTVKESTCMKKYIDVSAHQGTINFEKLKGNVDGVIIRAGYGKGNIDSQFTRNATECNRLGIPCGAYWFSYAYNAQMAEAEAKYFLNAVSKYKMELPLAFDYEYDSVAYGQKQGVNITAALVKSMTNAFCETIEQAKYWCMLYANPDFINRYFGDLAGKRYDLWLAQWPKNVDVNKPPRECGIWQWGTSNVPGIVSEVDTNAAYKDYATMIRDMGINNLPANSSSQTQQPSTSQPSSSQTQQPSTSQPWYTEAMKWAKDYGINDGTRPTETATRAEVTQMLYNYYQKFGK